MSEGPTQTAETTLPQSREEILRLYEFYSKQKNREGKTDPLAFEAWLNFEDLEGAWHDAQNEETSQSEINPTDSIKNWGDKSTSQNVQGDNSGTQHNNAVSPVFNVHLGGLAERAGVRQIPVSETGEEVQEAEESKEMRSLREERDQLLQEKEELGGRVDQLQSQFDELKARFDQLEQEKNELAEEVRQLKEDKVQLEAENARLNQELETLRNPPPPDGPEALGDTERNALENQLKEARDRLIEVTIRRSARMSDKLIGRAKEDLKAYEDHLKKYVEHLESLLEDERNKGVKAGKSEEDIRKDLTNFTYEERDTFLKEEAKKNTELLDGANGGKWYNPRRRKNNLLRWYASKSKKTKFLIGLTAGVGVSAVSFGAGLGLLGLAVGAGAKYSLGLVNRKASLINQQEAKLSQSRKQLEEARKAALANLGSTELVDHGNQLIKWMQNQNTETVGNRKRENKKGMVIVGATALAGAAVGGLSGFDVIPVPGLNIMPNVLPSGWAGIWNHNFGGGNNGGVTSGSDSAEGSYPQGESGGGTSPGDYPTAESPGSDTSSSPGSETQSGTPGNEDTTGSSSQPGAETAPTSGTGEVDLKNFHPDEFSGGATPAKTVENMMEVLKANHIQINGASPEKYADIAQEMMDKHMSIASGVDAAGDQFQTDFADWEGGKPPNYDASNLEGLMKGENNSSVDEWGKFMDIVEKNGIELTQAKAA